MIEVAREFGAAIRRVAEQNPVYPNLEPYQQLQRITDMIKDKTALLSMNSDGVLQIKNTKTTPTVLRDGVHILPNEDNNSHRAQQPNTPNHPNVIPPTQDDVPPPRVTIQG